MVFLARLNRKAWRVFIKLFANRVKIPREHLGTAYGGWTICPYGLNQDTLVYSFGIGEDISFDLAVIEKHDVQVFAFDPTPRSIQWLEAQELPERFKWYGYGIADYDGVAQFHPPENPEHISHTIIDPIKKVGNPIEVHVYRLRTILDDLGHDRIDVLKMDIEGAEYAVIQDMVASGIQVKQLLIEFHHNFPQISLRETINAVRLLKRAGYRVYNLSGRGYEYSFIHKESLWEISRG
jgi:FkbM family methyltransferase